MRFTKVVSNVANHSIVEARNGEDAVKILEDKTLPDLIVLDLNMPKVNGIEFLKIWKNNFNSWYFSLKFETLQV